MHKSDLQIDGPRVLVACGDSIYAATLVRFLEAENCTPYKVEDARGLLRSAEQTAWDVIVLDLDICDEASVDIVSLLHRSNPEGRIILIFDAAHLEQAIEGIRRGAYFYLPKSGPPSDIALLVGKAMRSIQTSAAANVYEQTLFEEMAGNSPAMRRVVELIRKVAPTDSTVLLLGESGTGKEVVAETLHKLSRRKDMPFIAINCAALPEALLESEMFGHLKGAFTGADSNKRGLFEEADGGTIFLDEIGDMSPITQAKLLRVLQSGEVRPVGSSTTRRVDVRVIAATNRDLADDVAQHRFREDLYFRLNVIQIRIPPLRERLDALAALIVHFIRRFNLQYGRDVRDVDENARSILRNYEYPGNVRELESIIAHAVIMSEGNIIRVQDLPEHVIHRALNRPALPHYDSSDDIPTLERMEEQLIRLALDKLDGNQTEAAKRLGISRSTLWRKMRQYGIPA